MDRRRRGRECVRPVRPGARGLLTDFALEEARPPPAGEGVASRGALERATGKGRIGCARSSSFCSCSQLAPPQRNRPEPPLTGRRRLNGPSVPSAPLSARNSRVAAAQSSVPRARPRSVSPAVAPSTPAGDSYAWKTRAVRASELSVDELAHWDCWGSHRGLGHEN